MWKKRAGIVGFGALLFWSPDLISAVLFRKTLIEIVPAGWTGLMVISITPVLLTLAGAWWLRTKRQYRRAIAPWFLLGIWCLGPVLILLSLTLCGAGLFVNDRAARVGMLFATILPVSLIEWATYDGTLFAVTSSRSR